MLQQQWQEILVNLIRPLPLSDRYDIIVVFTDRLSKGVLLTPYTLNIISEGFAKLFILTYYALYGLLRVIVLDRGPQFIGQVWQFVYKLLRIERRISTAFYPQTDRLTERTNAEVKVLLRQ